MKALPLVHLAGGQEATLRLPMHRGAVVSGVIRYADGSPALEVRVSCEPEVSAQERLRASGDGLKPLSSVGNALCGWEFLLIRVRNACR